MMPPRLLLASSTALVAALGCSLPSVPVGEGSDATTGAEAGEDGSICRDLRADTESILNDNCATCHGNGKTSGGLGGITDLAGLITRGYIVRGAADQSDLYAEVESGAMPLNGTRLSSADLGVIRQWIDECSVEDEVKDPSLTDPPDCGDENELVPPADVLAAIKADLFQLDDARARTTRYITFAHLHGAGFCEPQLEGYRHAFAKLINHLSFSTTVHVPVAIDPRRTIYRIDLVDYGWTPQTWSEITAADPYAIDFLSADARIIKDLSAIDLFLIKGDWFIEAASQPPLYHTILEIPETRQALEASLGIDVESNIATELLTDRDEVLRAGFKESDVAEFNRVIERHQLPDAAYRGYWISYDFSNENGRQNFFESPLDFEPAGGEIIFTLANGLQGYMVVDGDGLRVDRVPIAIAGDTEVPEEPEVINGLSCMSCHSEGMRLGTDEVRTFVNNSSKFDDIEKELVNKLYGPQDVFDRAQQRDIETFTRSLAGTGADRRVGDYEPVMAAHLAFDVALDLRRVAAEFGVSEAQLLKSSGQLEGLSDIDLRTVDRDTFELNFAFNACVLKLGLTRACPTSTTP